MTEPMKDRRIHAMGPPTLTSRDSIPLSTTMEGPMEVRAELLMALLTCSLVTPTSGAASIAFLMKISACAITRTTAIPQASHMGRLLAIFKASMNNSSSFCKQFALL